MPKTAKEVAKLKLIRLKGRLQNSLGRVSELQEMVESPSLDVSTLNLVVDNMLLSMEDFMSNFDDISPTSEKDEETTVMFCQSSPSSPASSKDATKTEAEMTDVRTRVTTLEQIVSEIKCTLYGDGGIEANSEIGILRHVHDLENSFNEGKQKLISFEERLQNVHLKCDSFIDEVRQERTKEDENSNVTLEKFHRFEERMEAVILENENCKQRLTRVEDQVKSMDSPKMTDDEVMPFKTELAQLKLKTESLDDFTRTAIINRINVLENHPVVAFSVDFKHNGPWKKGTVLRAPDVWFNIGNAFDTNHCRFLVPITGIYGMNLFVTANESVISIEVWQADGNEWGDVFSSIRLGDEERKCDTTIFQLEKGFEIYVRVFGGNSFQQCLFQSWLIAPL